MKLKEALLEIISKYSGYSEGKDRVLENLNIEPETVTMTVHAPLYSSPRTTTLTFDNVRVVIINHKIRVSLNNSKNSYHSVLFETIEKLKKFVETVLSKNL